MCLLVSHFRWNQKQTGDPNSSAADWELLSDPPHSSSSSLPGCLDRLFICPAWARKGYCDSKRRLMQKHCPSSCDFCYGKTRQQQQSGGKKRKFSLNWAAQGAAVNRLPIEQQEPTGPAMQSCDEGFQESNLKGDYTYLWGRVAVSTTLTGQSRLISVSTPVMISLQDAPCLLLTITAHRLLWLSETFVSNKGQCGVRQEDTIPG